MDNVRMTKPGGGFGFSINIGPGLSYSASAKRKKDAELKMVVEALTDLIQKGIVTRANSGIGTGKSSTHRRNKRRRNAAGGLSHQPRLYGGGAGNAVGAKALRKAALRGDVDSLMRMLGLDPTAAKRDPSVTASSTRRRAMWTRPMNNATSLTVLKSCVQFNHLRQATTIIEEQLAAIDEDNLSDILLPMDQRASVAEGVAFADAAVRAATFRDNKAKEWAGQLYVALVKEFLTEAVSVMQDICNCSPASLMMRGRVFGTGLLCERGAKGSEVRFSLPRHAQSRGRPEKIGKGDIVGLVPNGQATQLVEGTVVMAMDSMMIVNFASYVNPAQTFLYRRGYEWTAYKMANRTTFIRQAKSVGLVSQATTRAIQYRHMDKIGDTRHQVPRSHP